MKTMVIYCWKIWLVFTLVFTNYQVESSEYCLITSLEKESAICTAKIDCTHKLDFDVKTWDCIKHTTFEKYYRRDYYGNYNNDRREVTSYDENYNLIINVKEFNEMYSLLMHENNFIKLTLEGGDLVNIPEDIYKMEKLKELNIVGNKISTVNLKKFLTMSALTEICLKNNTVQFIENEEEDVSLFGRISNVKVIDVSNNLIEVLPNNFMSRFIQLQYLNLSHNMINSIGILTFEGIVQLQTLDLSHNKLTEIGHALARFGNLKALYVSYNYIKSLNEKNFATLSNLEMLNASFNAISQIEKRTFQNLVKLKSLDLRNNKLNEISNKMLNANTNLQKLLLSDNKIESIEENSFTETQLSEFCIQNNPLSGALKQNTFKGVDITELNLSAGNLTSIRDMSFANMSHLISLNLTSNSISNISLLAFSSLVSLSILDLSHNQLNEFYIDSHDLKNLTKLYAHHNKIEKIITSVFENLVSLKELDLSYNDLRQIEPHSFVNLNNILSFTVKGSQFVSVLRSKSLEGLLFLQYLDISETKTNVIQNESFSGLTALTYLNCAFSQISNIEYNSFLRSGQIKKLSLSNNQLQNFSLNTSTIPEIQEIYLDNNYIKNFSNETFANLTSLRVLILANNNLISLNPDIFQNLNSLTSLDLSFNEKMTIIGNPFKNLSRLHSLSLENVKKEISFKNSTASVEILSLQSCGISKINNVFIYNVHGLAFLNLSMNQITSIDKNSFRNITTLVSLDLSSNKIAYIQPGSFLHVKRLTILNLFGNDLAAIQFGVFDGIEFLTDLNISRNVLRNVDVKMLPNVSKLSLDDNVITHLNFEDFFETNVQELSVGGNQISCKVLAELKVSNYSEEFKQKVKTNRVDFHSENVNGISCQTIANIIPDSNSDKVSDNPSINISPLISTLRNVLEKLTQSLQIINDNTNSTVELKIKENDILASLNTFIQSNSKSQYSNTIYFSKIAELINVSNANLGEIKKYLLELANNNKKGIDYESTSITKSPIDDDLLRLEFQKMLKQENDAIRKEFRLALENISRGHPIQESLVSREKDSNDSKVVIYFMAVCLAIMLTVYIGKIIFKQVMYSRRSPSHSRTGISNSIEMG